MTENMSKKIKQKIKKKIQETINSRTSTKHLYDQKDFLYSRKGPWPQPSPVHPWGESPAVLHLPLIEKIDWWTFIGSRYVATLALAPYFFLKGKLNPGLKKVDDKEFEKLLNYSMMSKFLTDGIDDVDRKIFGDILTEDKHWFIIDLQAVENVQSIDGIYTSATRTLLWKDEKGFFNIHCIHVTESDEIFFPTDGDAWELAKYFMLQGGALCATLVIHPLLHFPFDSINAITKTSVPKEHILFQLIYPHTRFTLALENAVLNYKSSLLQDKPWMVYAPYPGKPDGLRDLLVDGHKGIKDNLSYPPFSYNMKKPKIEGKYGVYLARYYEVFYEFVSEILDDIQYGDFWISRWADYCNQHVNDFPDSEIIFEKDNLVRAVTTYLFTVTVAHSTDHYNYGNIDKRKVPLIIRHIPPKKGMKGLDRKKLVRASDQMKYDMADTLFFSPTTVTKLIDSKYKFKESKHKEAVKVFKKKLRALDAELKEKGIEYMPIDKIAASIQF